MKCIKIFLVTLLLVLFGMNFIMFKVSVRASTINLSTPAVAKAIPNSYKSISISWRAVLGAKGYAIYRSTTISGNYKLIGSTSGTKYINNGLLSGKTYYYKVKSYKIKGKTKIYSKFSAVIKAMTKVYSVTSNMPKVATVTQSISIANQSAEMLPLIKNQLISNVTQLAQPTIVPQTTPATQMLLTPQPVVEVVQAVVLNKKLVNLTVGKTEELIVSLTGFDSTTQLFWTSSDSKVATVDNTGKVTALKLGSTTITVKTLDNLFSAKCTVYVYNGIDVSKWQGQVNWSEVSEAGVNFVMLRSSCNQSYSDPNFEVNYANAKASGLAIGVYHYSYATDVSAAASEANFLISKLQGKQLDYPVVVDIEDPSQVRLDKGTLTNIALTYLTMLKQAGYYPMIYASKYWYNSELDDSLLASYDHWIAEYNSTLTYNGATSIWQCTSEGSVNGIYGDVDIDISYVDFANIIKSLHLNGY